MARGGASRWLSHPLTRGMALDDPRTTELRRQIVREKIFLREIYREWYELIAAAVPAGSEPVLELGSGPGFLGEYIDKLITSEIFPCEGIDLVLDGQALPMADASLRGVVMIDVLHHIPEPRRFFAEAGRVVRAGGVVVMIEPWVTNWSRFVYGKLHHEPFDPGSLTWEFPPSGPLSGANGAMPWIIFERDRKKFEREFPQWRIDSVRPIMPLRYLLSGGVSMRSLMPGFTFGLWRGIEGMLSPWNGKLAMFALIRLTRTAIPPCPGESFPVSQSQRETTGGTSL